MTFFLYFFISKILNVSESTLAKKMSDYEPLFLQTASKNTFRSVFVSNISHITHTINFPQNWRNQESGSTIAKKHLNAIFILLSYTYSKKTSNPYIISQRTHSQSTEALYLTTR